MNEEQFMQRVDNLEPDASQIDELCWDWLIKNAPDFGSDGEVAQKLLMLAKDLMH